MPTPPVSVTFCVVLSPKSNETLVIAELLLDPTAVKLTEKGAVPTDGSAVRLLQTKPDSDKDDVKLSRLALSVASRVDDWLAEGVTVGVKLGVGVAVGVNVGVTDPCVTLIFAGALDERTLVMVWPAEST